MSEETIICEDCTKDAGVTIYAVDRAEECVLCKLEAELQRHKFAIGRLYKCFREKEPMPRGWVDEAFALREGSDAPKRPVQADAE